MNLFITADGYSVTPLVPLMLFGWIPFSVLLFFLLPVRKAVLVSVVAGFLFLPMARYDVPGFNNFDKSTAIGIGLLAGTFLSGKGSSRFMKYEWIDLPMIIWCFVSPLATSISNNLGLYDGISGIIQNYFRWGIFYWTGRKFFQDRLAVKQIIQAILYGGLVYILLIFYEIRMSPQLHRMFYGYFPHIWLQHWRYGWYRPIVFMQHGLMVALWMAIVTTIAYWLWREKKLRSLHGIPAWILVFLLVIATILCRSGNGWFFLICGISLYSIGKLYSIEKTLQILLLAVPLYMVARMINVVEIDDLRNIAGVLFDDNRVQSLLGRLQQEMMFGSKAMERPLFGWGGYRRGWPVDPFTGQHVLSAVDSLWVITLSGNGFLGLVSIFLALGIGPGMVLKQLKRKKYPSKRELYREQVNIILLCIAVIFFMLDSLLNGMINPVFILSTGALSSLYMEMKRKEKSMSIVSTTRF